ncbi:OmpP1/FadL family transporter [Microbulbifer sp. SSSA002]|uniref:OmpP1/FadL family transporter n=1 Tax=unclassified Microbulbifer TaxID=2619833 RepID=UPI0040395F42
MNKNYLRHAVLAAAISSVSQGAMAAGFYLQETSTSGLGRAFAAENTIGDNAAILARNPAGSALFDTYTISLGATYVDPEIDVEGDTTYYVDPGIGYLAVETQGDAKDFATSAVIPNAYLAAPINDEWSWGLAMYTDFGLETDFPDTFSASTIANQTSLMTVNIQPSIAYDFNDQFSVGIAANIFYVDAELSTSFPDNFVIGETVESVIGFNPAGATLLNVQGDAWDLSWTIGGIWRISDNTRAGISYHAKYDPEIKGEVNSDIAPSPYSPFDDTSGELTLNLPDTLELGFYHRFNNNWGLALGYMWTNWDRFESLEAYIPSAGDGYNPLLLKEENFQSGSRFSVAGEYYRNNDWTFRFGYAYDQGAARDGLNDHETETVSALVGEDLPITWRTLSIPDTDRQWLTVGGTYSLSEQLTVDAAFAYIWGDDETIQEASYSIPQLVTYYDGGTTKTEAYLFSLALNYKF